MEDQQIIDLYWERSDRAITESDKKYGKYCGSIAYNICANHEDAEECVSDTWFASWNQMPPKRPNILSAFFGAITRNAAINRIRSQSREKRGGGETDLVLSELEQCIPAPDNVEKTVEMQELAQAVRRFAASLREGDRVIFLARYYYVLSNEEIASRLGCSSGKVRTTLYRLRQKLRKQLKEECLC